MRAAIIQCNLAVLGCNDPGMIPHSPSLTNEREIKNDRRKGGIMGWLQQGKWRDVIKRERGGGRRLELGDIKQKERW